MKKPPFTKKQAVYRALRERIFAMRPGEHLGRTIHQLAADFGVSHQTVSAAVRMLKREGLLIARRKVGLVVHPQRPEPEPRPAPLLFLTTHVEPSGPFEKEMLEGVKRAARRHGLYLLVKDLGGLEEARSLAEEGMLLEAVVSFYTPEPELERAAEMLAACGVRVCALDQAVEGFDSVLLDNRSIGRMAARYMFSRGGVRRALIMRRYNYAQAEAEREEGIAEVLEELSVPHTRLFWMSVISGDELVRRQIGSFLAAGYRFDLVFGHTPGAAEEVRRFMLEATGSEPFAVAVGTEAELGEHRVAGIAVSPAEMGEKAVELLAERRREPFRPPQTLRLAGRVFLP